MRVLTLVILLLLPVLGPQAHATTLETARKTSSGTIVFLRGISGVFSLGLDQMSNDLSRRGLKSEVIPHDRWQSVGNRIIANRTRNGAGPVVIIGHSLGANAAIRLARYLQGRKIPVRFLATLDPTVRQAVPSNVEKADNYYLPGSLLGKPLVGEPGFTGTLRNIKLETTVTFGHFSMDEDDRLQRALMTSILNAVYSRQAAATGLLFREPVSTFSLTAGQLF
jgi:pimeloyl-ACP methyl ester carboxylesterase